MKYLFSLHQLGAYMFGKRPDGRLVKDLDPMQKIMPYIMKTRTDSMNMYEDTFPCGPLDAYIKEKAAALVEKIQSDPALLGQFRENPVKLIEELIGMDLPDDQIKQVAELVKAKIDLDKAGDLLKGIGGLFGKK